MSPSNEMDSRSSSIYSLVPTGEHHDTLGRPTAKDATKRVKIIALLAFVVALILALLFIFPREKLSTNGYNREKLPQKGPFIPVHVASHSGASPCGHDRAAALENGCIFDMLAYAWVPHQCYDEELTNEYFLLQFPS
jgi:hypothetical protein